MDNDLNTPEALAAIDGLVSVGYQIWKELEEAGNQIRAIRGKLVNIGDLIFELTKLLGLDYQMFRKEDLAPDEKRLVKQYEAARSRKDFETSDKIRNELFKRGFIMRDTFGGSIPIPIRRT